MGGCARILSLSNPKAGCCLLEGCTELTELGWSNLKSIGGNPEHRFIAINFDSSQFGVLDESTGDFFPGGQD
jgi:hypothetical protein